MVALDRVKKFVLDLSLTDWVDVKIISKEKNIIDFSLNYRAMIGEEMFEVYRVDNAHGYLHEQRYWISPQPIPIKMVSGNLKNAFDFYFEQILQNFGRYRGYYLKKLGK